MSAVIETGYNARCRECAEDLGTYDLYWDAEEAADEHNREKHASD